MQHFIKASIAIAVLFCSTICNCQTTDSSWRMFVDTSRGSAKQLSLFSMKRASFVVYDKEKLIMKVTDTSMVIHGDTLSVIMAIVKGYAIEPNLPVRKPHPLQYYLLKGDFIINSQGTEYDFIEADPLNAARLLGEKGWRVKDGRVYGPDETKNWKE